MLLTLLCWSVVMLKLIGKHYLFLVNATLTETRQFYTLYNTLEDQKAYMEKEVRLWLFRC